MKTQFNELKDRLLEINDLNAAAAVLYWDQTTYMPSGGSAARGRQLASLNRLAHEKFIDLEIGRLLDRLAPYEESQPYDSLEASLLRVTRREYERAIRLPPDFVAEYHRHTTACYEAWAKARPQDDFPAVAPYLEKTLDLSRRWADYYPGYEHIADPLIDISDPGMKASSVKALFATLRDRLVPLVEAVTAQPEVDDAPVRQAFPHAGQLAFGEAVIADFGFDFERGRQDLTLHPFMIKFATGDVRITTKVDPGDLTTSLFSTLHEAGHAMYEQGIRPELDGTPLADGASSGVHESQSRLWENLVGRSLGFWEHYYPQLQRAFPDQLGSTSLEAFYRAINKVARSLIRTEADEVTYNLHVILRFDLELDLLEGRLAVNDLPGAWHARYESDLGLRAPGDRDGVLQDVHWYDGRIGGAFQGYTLGNIMSAQFFEAALAAEPGIPGEIAAGRFSSLHGWLKAHIYQHGAMFTPEEIILRATGKSLEIEPYLRYLTNKFGEIYPH